MFCMRKNSHRKCSRTGGLLRFAKDFTHLSTLRCCKERNKKDLVSDSFCFSFSWHDVAAPLPIFPTCSQYRRHAQDPLSCRRIAHRVTREPFFSLLFSFIISSFSCCTIIRSINVYYASSIPWMLDSRVILFVFSFYYYLWMTLLSSFKERPLYPNATLLWLLFKEILMIEDMDVRESFNSERRNAVHYRQEPWLYIQCF